MRRLIQNVVTQRSPAKLFVVRIDNWFGENWLGFGGKVMGAVGVHPTELTVPPFKPSRVVSQRVFARAESGSYAEVDSVERLHRDIPSEENLRRTLRAITESGVFVWFSGNSQANGRGSVLVYDSTEAEPFAWYAGIARSEDWRIASQKGISRETVESLIAP